jgi:hypothetical protein
MPALICALPLLANKDWKAERNKVKAACIQCHGNSWIEDFYARFDKAVVESNFLIILHDIHYINNQHAGDGIAIEQEFDFLL